MRQCISRLDWRKLTQHLDCVEFCDEHLADLAGHIRRSSDLICKHPNHALERKRNQFRDQLRNYVATNVSSRSAEQIDTDFALLERIEKGYRSLLDVLQRCEISSKPAAVRVSGIISRACAEYLLVIERQKSALSVAKRISTMSDLLLKDEDGNTFTVDAALQGISASVAMTLIMEAHKNGWYEDDVVVIPKLESVGDDVRFQAGATRDLALYWQNWQRVEQRRRYLGGDLCTRDLTADDGGPLNVQKPVVTIIDHIPADDGLSDCEVHDYIANRRLRDRLTQTFIDMEFETDLASQGVGISNGAALPPVEIVSPEEAHACVTLSEILGYSIVDDQEKLEGLRLLEWVRGYAVLQELAKLYAEKAESNSDKDAVEIGKEELFDKLRTCGLGEDAALSFLSVAQLRKRSRDMFDCPLVRVGSSSFLLFCPAAINTNIAVVVLSNLSNRGAELGRKGRTFEKSIQQLFLEQGLECFSFKASRGGQEFEYDAVVPWGNYIFVLECKNVSLSGGNPVQAYYFAKGVNSQAKQARRLANALVQYPDIVGEQFGMDVNSKTVIPCVVHSLPYSRGEDIDGVYFYDASALRRFFEERHFHVKIPHRVGAATILHRSAVQDMWSADTPSAEDLREQMEKPAQFLLSASHLDLGALCFGLSESECVRTRLLSRREVTAESVCEANGVDPKVVLDEIAMIAEKVAQVRGEQTDGQAGDSDD